MSTLRLFMCGLAGVMITMPAAGLESAVAEGSTNLHEAPLLRHATSVGVFYSKGDYGQEADTRIRFLPIAHEIAFGSLRVKATIPLLEISGADNVLVNIGSTGSFAGGNVSSRGLGDLLLNITYEIPAFSESSPFFDVSFELKLPTADEQRALGTGKVDGGLQIDAYQSFADSTIFASLGWKYRQSSAIFGQLNSSWTASAGFSYSLTDRSQLGLIYDYRRPISPFSGSTHELLPYVSWSLASQWNVMCYVVKGFTEDSADLGLGTQLSFRW
jgi:opacity protein-like surface antigen